MLPDADGLQKLPIFDKIQRWPPNDSRRMASTPGPRVDRQNPPRSQLSVALVVIVTSRPKSKMAMSDVDVSSSLDQDEDPLAELTDEELFNLVQETL